METIQTHTPWRARSTCAKIWHHVAPACARSVQKMRELCRDPRQSYPRLTDRQARDIGLDPADLEFRRLQYPSQSTRHPML